MLVEQGLNLWHFIIVSPKADGGLVEFDMAIDGHVRKAIYDHHYEVWQILLEQIVYCAERALSETD
jgi:hypothetical protein